MLHLDTEHRVVTLEHGQGYQLVEEDLLGRPRWATAGQV